MSPEPSTNDYLADKQTPAEELLALLSDAYMAAANDKHPAYLVGFEDAISIVVDWEEKQRGVDLSKLLGMNRKPV